MNPHQESFISLPDESIMGQIVFLQQFNDFKCNLVCLCQNILQQAANNSGNISQCTGFAFKATFTLLFFQNVNKQKHVNETIGGIISTPLVIFLCAICNEDCSS
jgi:hypothetical protein